MIERKKTQATWQCTCCKQRTTIHISKGTPNGGSCGKQPRESNGRYKPHVWVKIGEH